MTAKQVDRHAAVVREGLDVGSMLRRDRCVFAGEFEEVDKEAAVWAASLDALVDLAKRAVEK